MTTKQKPAPKQAAPKRKPDKQAGTVCRVRVVLTVDIDYDQWVRETGLHMDYPTMRGLVQDEAAIAMLNIPTARLVAHPTNDFIRGDDAYGAQDLSFEDSVKVS